LSSLGQEEALRYWHNFYPSPQGNSFVVRLVANVESLDLLRFLGRGGGTEPKIAADP